jgi:hypothetical protein
MPRKKSKKTKTDVARPDEDVVQKENRVTTRRQGQAKRDHSEDEREDDDTESEPSSSPLTKKSGAVLRESRTNTDRGATAHATDTDEKEIKPDKDLVNLADYLDIKYASDSKVNKDARMDVIVKLHTKVYRKQQMIYSLRSERYQYYMRGKDLQKTVAQLEQDKTVLEATTKKLSEKLETKKSEYEELKLSYQRKLTELTGKRKKPLGNEENSELVASIKIQASGFLFSKCKFVNSDAQERNLGRLMLKYGTIPDEHKEDTEAFVSTYSKIMRRQIFDRRSYVQTEFRKIFRKLWTNREQNFPSVESLLKCLQRNIETDEEYEVFVFYCKELLSRVVGAAEWSKKSCCFKTMSSAMRQNTKIPLISPSDEAFVVLVVDNCLERWTEERIAEDVRATGKNPPKKAVNGKYTRCNAGQVVFGGWSPDGLKYYNDLLHLNKEARESPRCKIVEEKCLELLRKKHKVTAKTWEEQRKSRSKKRGIDEVDETADDSDVEVLAEVEMIPDSDDEESTA